MEAPLANAATTVNTGQNFIKEENSLEPTLESEVRLEEDEAEEDWIPPENFNLVAKGLRSLRSQNSPP